MPIPPRPLPKALSPAELDALLAVPKNRRDQALLQVLAGGGLRVSEACHLTLEQLHWSSDTPALRFTGKGRKERVVPLNHPVQEALRQWLEVRGHRPSGYLFCTLRRGGRLSRKTVWAALQRYARKAGLRPVHPHMLRHTFGTGLADRGVPVERIRELMGHASIQTSQLYITVSSEQKRQAVERLDRRGRLARWWSRQRNRSYRFFGRRPTPALPLHRETVGRQAELHYLQDHLERGIDTLVAAGTDLNICAGDTLHHAFALGYHVVAVGDCLACFSKRDRRHAEQLKEAGLYLVENHYGLVARSEEIIRIISGGR